ncbi:MAG: FUSC family protein [Psychrobacter sp.]|nr:FUSC family protein [Psychrobacter sp.]
MRTIGQRFSATIIEPYARYQHADVLHAIRLGLAVVTAMLVNLVSGLPHGEWTTITVFIILGLLQYQGAIYTKAKERVLGTLLGIVIGLSLLWLSQHMLGYLWLYYALIGVISSIIGYFAIKQLGYLGMLTGITMCMIISSTSSLGQDGLFRALNVLIGTLIAVSATFILPLKSTLMWRFLLASNIEACADIYTGVAHYINQPLYHPHSPQNLASSINEKTMTQSADNAASLTDSDAFYADTKVSGASDLVTRLEPLTANEMAKQLKVINQRLLKVRGHIAATTGETGIDKSKLEQIQRTHRNIIGTIDLLLSAAPKLAKLPIDDDNRVLLVHYQQELTQGMRHMAAVLRSPSDEVFRPLTKIQVSQYPSISSLIFDWQGYFWLTQTLQVQLQSLSDLLKETKPKWFAASGLGYQRREQRRIKAYGGEGDLDI